MRLGTVVTLCDEAPWCGTKPHGPGFPGPHPTLMWLRQIDMPIGPDFSGDEPAHHGPGPGPQFLSTREETRVALFSAVAIYQVAQILPTAEQATMILAAEKFYDDEGCGNIPYSVLLSWLLHRPPPPPPWVDGILFAARILQFSASLSEGPMRNQFLSEATRSLNRALSVLAKVELNPQPLPPRQGKS
jgi:hypothetical protein